AGVTGCLLTPPRRPVGTVHALTQLVAMAPTAEAAPVSLPRRGMGTTRCGLGVSASRSVPRGLPLYFAGELLGEIQEDCLWWQGCGSWSVTRHDGTKVAC